MRLRVAILLALTLLGALVAMRGRVTTDLADALPATGTIGNAFRDVERFSLLDTVWIEIDGTGRSEAELHAAVDALGARLAARPDFSIVRYRFDLADGARLRAAAEPHLAVLTDEAVLRERTSPAGLDRLFERAQARLLSPAGSMIANQLTTDPLDLGGTFTASAMALGAGDGVRLVGGHLLARDSAHALLFARANTPALGTTLDSPLVRHLREDLAASPLPADWLGSHRFAAEAERLIRKEVNVAVSAGMALVAMVFLLAFRSLRALLGTVAPTAVGAAFGGAAAALVSPVHGMALAFAGALAGMGVDYWIHLYVTALRTPVASTFAERLAVGRATLWHLLPAYLISVAATATAFGLLTTSSYPAVSDLGFIGLGVAGGAFLTVLLGGPALFALVARPGDAVPKVPVPSRVPGWIAVLVGLGLVGLAGAATGVRFDGDPRSMDARLPDTAAFEAAFEERYGGGGTTGLVVAEGSSVDEALTRLTPAVDALQDASGVTVQSPLPLLPSPDSQRSRAEVAARPESESDFAAAAEAAGFDASSLLPGLRQTLAATTPPTAATWAGTLGEDILARTLDDDGNSAAVAAVVSAVTQEALDHARNEVALSGAEVRFVHPAGVAEVGADRIRHELLTRSGAGLLCVLLFMALRYRDVPRVLAAAFPSLAAAAGTLGVLALTDTALTPISGPAFVLILGLAFDQGIFLVESKESGEDHFRTARAAIVIALCTAFGGFAGLLSASHPGVWGVGAVVTLGIVFTAAGAFLCVPAMLTESGMAWTRSWTGRIATACVLALALDTVISSMGWLQEPETPAFRQYPIEARSPTDRRYGPNRLARVDGTWLMRLEGTAWEIGRASAILAADLRQTDEDALVEEFYTKVPSRLVQYLLVRGLPLFASRMAATVPPAAMEEIAGGTSIDDDAGDPYGFIGPRFTRKFCYHAIHDVGQAMVDNPWGGCTGFAAGGSRTRDGRWLLARNWDFDGGRFFDENKAVIVVRREGAIPFVHVAIAGLVGAVSGVNEAGIAVAVFAAGSDAPIRFETPMTFIIREILETATSLEDVQRTLDQRRGFVSENVLAVDGERGAAAVFEVTPDDVHRLDAGEWMAVANHLRGPHADDEQNRLRMEEGTTVARLARMGELTRDGILDETRAIAVLRDRGGSGGTALPAGHESAMNADITSHGVVIDATSRTVTVSGYPNTSGTFTRFSLPDVLGGEMAGIAVAPPDDPGVAYRTHAARELVRVGGEASARKALRLNPGSPEALLELGRSLLAEGDRSGAAEALSAAMAVPLAHAADQRAAAALLAEATR